MQQVTMSHLLDDLDKPCNKPIGPPVTCNVTEAHLQLHGSQWQGPCLGKWKYQESSVASCTELC
jgi:hypothetical protein